MGSRASSHRQTARGETVRGERAARQSAAARLRRQRFCALESLEGRNLMAGLELAPIGTYASGIFAESATEIAAYDPVTQRVFVTNAAENTIRILSLKNPANPVVDPIRPEIDLSSYGGGPNSVAVYGGIVAVAVEANDKTDPGSVVFFSTAGTFLRAVEVGALPDMLTFTADGKRVVVANEGEPNSYGEVDSVDPEGSVSIIDLSAGVAAATVATADFTAFNGQEAALRTQGIRIFGPGASAAQDFEPEYVAISPDGTQAFVTLQENNALAVVDLATATVLSVTPLGYKDHNQEFELQTAVFPALPSIGTTVGGQNLTLGGFSGLFFEGVDASTGRLQFVAHTDRGPNGEPNANAQRPFLLPDFAPQIVRFEFDQATGAITLTEQIELQVSAGVPLTGLPNTAIAAGTGNTPFNDEVPIDLFGAVISPLEPLGADLEGIVVAADGSFWMVDEYRPAIYHFDPTGVMIDRFVPIGTAAAAGQPAGTFGTEVLPAVIAQRRQNRGFEAIAEQDGKIYAFVQSPVRNPVSLGNSALNGMRNIRVVEFDPDTQITRQFLYVMDNANLGGGLNTRADKIGDAVATPNGDFLVLERDDDSVPSDPTSTIEKKIYRFRLSGATDVSGMDGLFDVGGGVMKSIDQMTPAELDGQGIAPVAKTLHVDLNAAVYNAVQKVEGLALVDNNTLAVINDNDFGVAGININQTNGTFTLLPGYVPEPVVLGLITTKNGLDASDRDGEINIQNWPVLGMYQPDAIASFEVGGQTYLVTANEGDARDWDGYAEEERIKDLDLDPVAFPNAAALQADDQIGRLTVTTASGDADDDGLFEELYAFGARSFSIWNADGELVYDSGDDFEQITAAALPDFFNASNDNNNFDNRSDNKGPEPEGVVLGEIAGRTYAFIGLERIGGVMVYDVTNPESPTFIQYVNNRDFSEDVEDGSPLDLGVEGLIFISANDSPSGVPLVLTTNEVSGTLTVFAIHLESGARVTEQGVLEIIGTPGRDQVTIRRQGNTLRVDSTFLPARSTSFPLAGITSIHTVLGGGDDHLRVDQNVTLPLIAEGNAGSDFIFAGGGAATVLGNQGADFLYSHWAASVLSGGAGNDFLIGGDGRNILIGGAGVDYISGAGQQDILIGGTTSFDNNLVALETIRTSWNGVGAYSTRRTALQLGINSPRGLLKLVVNGGTIQDDRAIDLLFSGFDQDWVIKFGLDYGS